MSEKPSSEAPEQHEKPDEKGQRKSFPPPPPTAALSSAAPMPETSPSLPSAAAAASHPDPAFPSSSAAKAAAPKTLAITVPAPPNSDTAPSLGGGPHCGGECRSFSQLLAGAMSSPLGNSLAMPIVAVPVDGLRLPVVAVPCFIAPAALLESPGIPGQFAMTHQAVLATVTAQAQIQLQSGYTSPTVPEISPVPAQQRSPSASEDNVISPGADQPSSDQKLQSAQIVLKTTSGDRFNWRKYGQKQVKSSENSRSYYRCTQSNCSAKKKVERCQDGRVIEVIYKGGHNHDPPQKIKCSKERRPLFFSPSGDNETLPLESGPANGTVLSPSKVEQDCGSETPEQQLHCSSDCEADGGIKTEEDLDEEPDIKRSRLTERPVADPVPLSKAVKEPKVVVQKASEVGLSSDGYKWRKYGQKNVKGNPNPRSYYKCTQMGCPARKHVERDSADAKAMIIHYEGNHNHDLPTPKNGSDSSATTLLVTAAAAAAAINADRCVQSPSPCVEKRTTSSGQHPDLDSK